MLENDVSATGQKVGRLGGEGPAQPSTGWRKKAPVFSYYTTSSELSCGELKGPRGARLFFPTPRVDA